ncbi:MAG: hypothetical protein ACYCV7_06715, partial [Acidimicrobiales bacterium]
DRLAAVTKPAAARCSIRVPAKRASFPYILSERPSSARDGVDGYLEPMTGVQELEPGEKDEEVFVVQRLQSIPPRRLGGE